IIYLLDRMTIDVIIYTKTLFPYKQRTRDSLLGENMKTILTIVLALLSTSILANTYRLKDRLCGEVDPYVIGDACVLVLENKKEDIVVIGDEMFQAEIGTFFLVDKKFLEA